MLIGYRVSMNDNHKEEEQEVARLLADIRDKELRIAELTEAVWSGSHGGHDPEFFKLNKELRNFWIKKVRTHPTPFRYCVRHLSKRVANPQRLCAWLKDQALGTTKWRNLESDGKLDTSNEWQPSIEELRDALICYEEAEAQLDEETSPANTGKQAENPHENKPEPHAETPEAENNERPSDSLPEAEAGTNTKTTVSGSPVVQDTATVSRSRIIVNGRKITVDTNTMQILTGPPALVGKTMLRAQYEDIIGSGGKAHTHLYAGESENELRLGAIEYILAKKRRR